MESTNRTDKPKKASHREQQIRTEVKLLPVADNTHEPVTIEFYLHARQHIMSMCHRDLQIPNCVLSAVKR